MKSIRFDPINAACGAVFIAFGAVFAWQSLRLRMGTALNMGPGYFPLMLAGVLILLGLGILISATRTQSEPPGSVAWRGIFVILPAPIVFGLTVRGLGFVPAIFLTALVAAFASIRMKPLYALGLAIAVTVFSYAVFIRGLGLPYAPFGPWLRF